MIVLFGWAFHVSALVSIAPGLASMKPNTALAFLLTGLALIRRKHRDRILYSLIVLTIGTVTLIEYLWHVDFGVDQLLFRDPYAAIDPGRMSVLSGLGFALLGIALILMESRSERSRRISRALSLATGALGGIALFGYSYGTQVLYQIYPYPRMALHTVVGLVIAAMAMQCANPREGIVGRIQADSPAGAMLRQLLPAALLLPYVLGLLVWIAHKQLGWEMGFSLAMLVASVIGALVVIMLLNARHLDREALELRKSNRTLEERTALLQANEELLKTFVERVPAAVAMLDRELRYLQVSDRWCTVYSLNALQLLGRSHLEIFPDLPERWKQILRRGLAGESLRAEEDRWDRADGSTQWLRWEIRPWGSRDYLPEGILILAEDITDRKLTGQKLQESEERFRLVANTAPVMIWMSGTDKLCNYFNQKWLEFTGRTLEMEIGNGWTEGVHHDDLNHCMETYMNAFDRREAFQMRYRLRRRDGEYRWLLDNGVPRFNLDGSFAGYIGSCIDITEIKLAEEALADMGRKLIQAQEQERTWIARELHDDINQRIAVLAIELDKCGQEITTGEREWRDRLHDIQSRLIEMGRDIQALSHRLHSSHLNYLGLAIAAKNFCKELSEQQNVVIEFNHTGIAGKIPEEVALCLFRVLQEALHNAVKHSGVRTFTVDLEEKPGEIQLTVSDPGAGFDQQDAMNQHGLGLISMRERLQMVSGQLLISSRPGRGTIVIARAPVRTESTTIDGREMFREAAG